MTDFTRLNLAAKALEELLIVGTGQSPDAEDIEKVDGRFDAFMAELEARGVVSLADDQDIPVEWTGPLAELLASYCARSFGKNKMTDAERESVEDLLRVMVGRQGAKKLKFDKSLPTGDGYGYSLARWERGT